MEGPERSRTLHNFSLPSHLSWGTHKLLRCSNSPSSTADHHHRKHRRKLPSYPSTTTTTTPIEAVREKLILDLRSEVDLMRATLIGTRNSHPPPPPPPPLPPPESRPWNLRTRRAACKDPASTAVVVEGNSEVKVMTSSPARGVTSSAPARVEVAIKRREVEEDFMEMVGRRPPRKPKKRPRNVQKQLDTLFPGLWLSEVTADMYKVDENLEPGK